MLVLIRRRGEDTILTYGDVEIVVRVIECVDNRVKLGFFAPRSVNIVRSEVLERAKQKDVSTQ